MKPARLTLTRRQLLRLAAAGAAPVSGSGSGWIEALARDAAGHPQRRGSCILLWMAGGPSQLDTFDLKPSHLNGGPFKPIETSVPGVWISEHLPKLAKRMQEIVLVRSMSTKEGDHGRATYHLRTGYMPRGPVQYPALGALVARERANEALELPGFISIGPYRPLNPAAYEAGFLGPEYAPLVVGEPVPGQEVSAEAAVAALRVEDLEPHAGIDRRRGDARLGLLGALNDDYLATHPGALPAARRTAYARAVKLMRSARVRAFNLDEEPAKLRDTYGRNPFGQGCLLACRLVQQGVPFVEVALAGSEGNQVQGWDTHTQNFERVKRLSAILDAGWSALIDDLWSLGLLDSTLIVWMGEFGRTPRINTSAGRDHFPAAWTTALAGGGLSAGRAIGRTSVDGMTVEDRPVSVPDFIATICLALGIDPKTQNLSNVGRPIRIADPSARPILEVIA